MRPLDHPAGIRRRGTTPLSKPGCQGILGMKHAIHTLVLGRGDQDGRGHIDHGKGRCGRARIPAIIRHLKGDRDSGTGGFRFLNEVGHPLQVLVALIRCDGIAIHLDPGIKLGKDICPARYHDILGQQIEYRRLCIYHLNDLFP